MNNTITRQKIEGSQRINHTAALFGNTFPLVIEPVIYTFAERLSPTYCGGYWHFHELSNGGFYMAPDEEEPFLVIGDNGFEGVMSADSFGITVCLHAYSHLSFSNNSILAKSCAQHYHLLRAFMFDHAEVTTLLAATD